jgi:hypothetical protein
VKQWFEQLKPQERRYAVIIGSAVFLILNYFFVWPHFGDWKRYDARIKKDDELTATYNKEVRLKPTYQHRINELQSDSSPIPPEDQAIDFIHFYSSRALSNKVSVVNQGTLTTQTNAFFLEQQMGIIVVADETNLVNFLYSLGSGNSMMRVRAMSLHPSQNHQDLNANITLVASYQKKTPVRSTTPGATPARGTAANTPAPNTLAGGSTTPVKPMGAQSPLTVIHTNRAATVISRTPGPGGTNKPVPSIAKRP